MNNLRLNETPVRTSVNFGINDIVLNDVHVPENIGDFNNICIKSNNSKIDSNANIDNVKLVYGVGEILESQINSKSNKNIKIDVEKNDENIEIDFNFNRENNVLVDNIDITCEEESSSTIVLKYMNEEDNRAYCNGICRVKAKKNSSTKIVVLNFLNEISDNFLSIESEVDDEATVNVVIVDFGGKNSISNYYSNALGYKSQSTIDTIYLGDKKRLIDINYIVHLRGEKSYANIEVQGALKDESIKNFKGTLDFKTGSKKSVGNENEFCTLLSDKAKSKALPMLLCTEDDVEGNHSTASGKVNKNELFYMMSRGFSQKEAMKLLVRAKFTPIIDKIENEEIKKEILKEIDRRLD